ncbi:hypothetical protein HG431_003635, partial [Candidatus Saccharibacteria bacterium]|nr:hypothetical protein [Candidatus Saccharibacteria bacterium]
MERIKLTPKDIQPNIHRPRSLAALDRGERQIIPERDCNEVYNYKLPAEIIERANLGFDLDELPEYIGLKGGAARQVLEALVDDSRELTPPRDVDLVVLEEKLEGSDSDDVDGTIYDLSCRFSPRDTMHGYGAERIGSVNEHMEECDFTINQVLVCKGPNGWELKATTQAVLDTAEHIIRPTVYEHNEHHQLGNKLALKAVRLLSEMQVRGVDDARIEGVSLPHELYGDPTDDYFMQALQLDKALESGVDTEVAERYAANLKSLDMMPYGIEYEHGDAVSLYEALIEEANFNP